MRASRFVSSAIYNYLSMAFTTVTGLVYTAIVLRHLSHDGYGVMVLVGSIMSYTALLNLGVGLTVEKMTAERAHRDVDNEIPKILGNGIVLFGAVSLLAVVAALVGEPFAAPAFHVPAHERATFQGAFLVATLGMAVALPSGLYTAVHQAHQDYRYLSLTGIVNQAAGVAVGTWLLETGHGVVALVAVGTVQSYLYFIFKVRHARRKLGIHLELGRVDWGLARQMLSMSAWVFMLNVAVQAIFSSDVVVVGAVIGTAAAASYQVALGPATALRRISNQVSAITLTAASSLKAQDARSELQRLLLEGTRVVTAAVAPFVVVFLLWGRRMIVLWAGPSYASSDPTLVILSVALLVAAFQSTSTQLLFSLDRYRQLAVFSLVEAFLNLGASIVLAHVLGIVGVAIGTAVPIAAMTLCLYVPMACRVVGVRYGELLRRQIMPLTIDAAAYALLRQLTRGGSVFPDLAALLVASALVFLTCFALALVVDRRERPTYVTLLRDLLGHLHS